MISSVTPQSSSTIQPAPLDFACWNPAFYTSVKSSQRQDVGILSPYYLPLHSLSFFLFFIYLAASGLSLGMQDLRCIMWKLLLRRTDSLAVAHGFSSSFRACGILVPGPGIKLTSPALPGGFLTARPPGKSVFISFLMLLNLPYALAVSLQWSCIGSALLYSLQLLSQQYI